MIEWLHILVPLAGTLLVCCVAYVAVVTEINRQRIWMR